MPLLPDPESYYVQPLLGDVSLSYAQDQREFIADRVFAHVPVKQRAGRFALYTKDYWFRSVAQKRAPASESVGAAYKLDNSGTYFCDEWSVHHDIPWEAYANVTAPYNVDLDATALVTRNILLRRESMFATQYLTTGVWQGFVYSGSVVDFQPNVHGNGYWDSSTADPIRDIDKIKKSIKQQTGFMPNKLIMGENVYLAVRNNPAVLARIQYGGTPSQPAFYDDKAVLARLFGVDEVLVAGAVNNTASEGATANMQFMVSNGFLLCYAAPTPGLRMPSAGYIFDWVGFGGANAFGTTVRRMDMELRQATRIEASSYFAMAQTGKDLGAFGTSVLQTP